MFEAEVILGSLLMGGAAATLYVSAGDRTDESEPPIKSDEQGRYPVPVPGQWTEI